jgi:hypothetical protein
MRLFRLTLATIYRRKAWAICALAVLLLPFALPLLSSATERPALIQPARIQAAWATLWVCTLLWGLFTAATQGEANARSGVGEYFLTTGVSVTRQLLEIWLAVLCYIAPLTLATAAICLFAAAPRDPVEHSMWWVLNLQYATLFLLVTAPLLALATALSSRFGGIAGFAATLALALYGLYGVGYLDNMLRLDPNPLLQSIWLCSPQYRWADLTQRLYFKLGSIPADRFLAMLAYFLGLFAISAGLARLCFRTKSAA